MIEYTEELKLKELRDRRLKMAAILEPPDEDSWEEPPEKFPILKFILDQETNLYSPVTKVHVADEATRAQKTLELIPNRLKPVPHSPS